ELARIPGPVREGVVRDGSHRRRRPRELPREHQHSDEAGDEERKMPLHGATVRPIRQQPFKALQGLTNQQSRLPEKSLTLAPLEGEAVRLRRAENARDRVDVRPETAAGEAEPEVDRPQSEPHPEMLLG